MQQPQQEPRRSRRARGAAAAPTAAARAAAPRRPRAGPLSSLLSLLLVLASVLLPCHLVAGFLPPAAAPLRAVAAAAGTSSSRCWGQPQQGKVATLSASGDPGSEFVKRRPASTNATVAAAAAAGAARRGAGGAAGGRTPAMPPMKETMQLLFSPDKREVDKNRAKFREIVYEMQAAPLEAVMGIISRNVPFFMATNTTIFMQEMIEELDAQPEDGVVPLGGGLQVTVAQQRAALVNLFTLTMDFIEGFVNHTQGELRSHQAVLKEILEAAQNKSASALEETIKRLRPHFREDFVTYLRGEYEKVAAPPMTEEGVVLANLLQAVQARVLAEVEDMMGADVSQVSRLLAFADEEQVQTALRGSFLAGTVKPDSFLEMVEMVLSDLDERMPAPLEAGEQAAELREMHSKLSAIRAFTRDYLQSLQ